MKKRLMALLLSLCMIVSLLPATVLAAGGDEKAGQLPVAAEEEAGAEEVSDRSESAESIEYIPAEGHSFMFYEETCGEWRTIEVYDEVTGEYKEEEFYQYHIFTLYNYYEPGDRLLVHNTDGTTQTLIYNDNWEWVDEETGEAAAYSVDCTDDQYESHWTLGSENYITYTYMGKEAKVAVTILPNPVESIEFIPGEDHPFTYLEETNGYWTARQIYDEVTGEYKEEVFYCYYFTEWKPGDRLLVHNTDGTTQTLICDDDWAWVDEETGEGTAGLVECISFDQYVSPWTLGSENYVTYTYLGKEVQVAITILPNPVESIEFIPGEGHSFTFIEETNGYWTSRSVYDEATGEYKEEEFFYYYFGGMYQGDRLLVHKTDGTTQTLIYNDNWEWVDEETGEETEFQVESFSSQYESPWTPGSENYVTYSYMNREVKVAVTILPNPVESIEFLPGEEHSFTLYEEMNGYWTSRSVYDEATGEYKEEEFYYYNFDSFYQGDRLLVHKTDGTTQTLICNDNWEWVDEETGEAAAAQVGSFSSQNESPWTPGSENYVTYSYMDREVKAAVTILPNPVESIEFLPAEGHSFTCVEETNGYWTSHSVYDEATGEYKEEEFFYYYFSSMYEGDRLLVHNTDGTTRTLIYDNQNWVDEETGEATAERVGSGHDQYGTPWTLGSENYVTYTYMGKEVKVAVTVLPNPVESIEFLPGEEHSFTLYEEAGGYWGKRTVYDEETGEYKEEEFYIYATLEIFQPGDRLLVHNTDGTTQTLIYNDNWNWVDEETGEFTTEPVGYTNDQYGTPWTLGSENYVTISYMHRLTQVAIMILPNPVASIEYTPAEPIELIFETEGSWEEAYYWDDETGEQVSESYFRYDYTSIKDGDQLTIHYTDGNTKTYRFYDQLDDTWSTWRSVEDVSDKLAFDVIAADDQNAEHWTLGAENYYRINVLGRETRVQVTIIENPIESIEYTPISPIELIENLNGYWNSVWQYNPETDRMEEVQVFMYYDVRSRQGDILTIHYTDGTTAQFELEDVDETAWYNTETGEKLKYPVSFYGENMGQWSQGSDNYAVCSVLGREVRIPVTILPNPVESIEFTPVNDPWEIIEYTHGNWETGWDDNEFYYYYIDFHPGDQLTVHYTDGSAGTFLFENNNRYGWFDPETGEGAPYDVQVVYDQYSNHWERDKECSFTIRYMGAETVVPVVIIENPVDHIAYTPVTPRQYYENVGGSWETRQVYNEETGEWEEEPFYYYNVRTDTGDVITVYYKDGTSKDYTAGGYYWGWYADDGEELEGVLINSDQWETPWTLGSDNYYSVSVMGKSFNIEVTILPNPVESIEFVPVQETVYVENFGGYWETYEYWDDDEHQWVTEDYYWYELPGNQRGDLLTVHYTDGTVSIFEYNYGWYDRETGESLPYSLTRQEDQNRNHWKVGDKNFFTIEYMGHEVIIPVSIIENPVDSIEIELAEPVRLLENADGWIRDGMDGQSYFYYSYPSVSNPGNVLTVHYTDGTTGTYSYRSLKNGYGWYSVSSDEELPFTRYLNSSDTQEEEHWQQGTNYYTVSYLGKECRIPAEVIENPWVKLEYVPAKEIVLIEGYHSATWTDDAGNVYARYNYRGTDGDKLILTGKDGSKKTLTVNMGKQGYAYRTLVDENGVLFNYELYYNSDQETDHWGYGEHTFTVQFIGLTTELKVTVTANPVESIEYIPVTEDKLTFYEFTGSGSFSYNSDGDIVFYEYMLDLEAGDRLKVNYTDGTTHMMRLEYDADYQVYLIDETTGQEAPESSSLTSYSQVYYENYNGTGGILTNNGMTVQYLGKTCHVDVVVLKSPYTSLSLTPATVYSSSDAYLNWYDTEKGIVTVRMQEMNEFGIRDGSYAYLEVEIGEDGVGYIPFVPGLGYRRYVFNTSIPGATMAMCDTDKSVLYESSPNDYYPIGTGFYYYWNNNTEEKTYYLKVDVSSEECRTYDRYLQFGIAYNSDNVLKATRTDGTIDTFVFDKDRGTWVNQATGKAVYHNWWQINYLETELLWHVGTDNSYTLNFMGCSDDIPVTVIKGEEPQDVPVTGITLNQTSVDLATLATLQLTATVAPANATNKNLIWTSSDSSIASVDANGLVTAHVYGASVTITATAADGSGVKATCVVQTRFYDVMQGMVSNGAFKCIYWAADNKITAGYDKGVYFGPERPCSRQEFAIFLWRVAGQPDVSAADIAALTFTDLSDFSSGGKKAVAWAVKNGIIGGYKDGTFKPKNNITRQEIAIMLWRAAGKPAVTSAQLSALDKFPDVGLFSSGGKKAAAWANANGIITGLSNGNFGPTDDCTRAQIVVMLYRVDQKGLIK